MNNKVNLTQAEKEEIISDFELWSGGFTPDQCPTIGYDEPTHQSYIEHALDSKFIGKEEMIEDFLSDYPDSFKQ